MERHSVTRTCLSAVLFAAAGIVTFASSVSAQNLPREKTRGKLELVHTFYGPMPTGVTVSQRGRIFVNYPRWGDPVQFTVAEIKNGRAVAYPNSRINDFDANDVGTTKSLEARLSQLEQNRRRLLGVFTPNSPEVQNVERQIFSARQRFKRASELANYLVSVQSVVVDPADRLWILDTGSVKFGPTSYGGPKLVGVDLRTNRIFKKILFPRDVALPTTYLNDIRFDLRRGSGGMAFITDSSGTGPNGIIVVDLASGRSWRKLNDHPSTKAEPKFVPFVEGWAMLTRKPGQKPGYVKIGSDGIAISADGERLYYCPLASRKLYSVSVDALADADMAPDQVAATVINHGDKGASDGLESDSQNHVYVTNYEQNAIVRRLPNGLYEPLVHDPRVLWPDTLSLARNGYLYFIANQLHRQPNYNYGKDLRQKPYSLFRVKVNARPVRLRPNR
jgi:sugar lactone lactonase YvrE